MILVKCKIHFFWFPLFQSLSFFQVILITGDTGSGKTTQVPQFLLEDAYTQQRPVRVVVCEPRRLAVTTVSERVAQVFKSAL